MRAIWSGSISFGLVNIPVKLYSASEDASLSFDFVHKVDFSPIRYAKVCKEEGKELSYDEVTRAFELENGDYVPVSEEDFQKANKRKTKSIEIINFSLEAEIDPVFFEKPYFLEPDKGSDKPYALLLEALKRSKRVGVAKYVLRNREHLAIVRPKEGILVLNQLRFAQDLRQPDELRKPDKVEMSQQEISLALALIDQLTKRFDPQDYRDTYTAELKEIIEEKSKGITPISRGKEPVPTEVKDLMAILKASLKEEKEKVH